MQVVYSKTTIKMQKTGFPDFFKLIKDIILQKLKYIQKGAYNQLQNI